MTHLTHLTQQARDKGGNTVPRARGYRQWDFTLHEGLDSPDSDIPTILGVSHEGYIESVGLKLKDWAVQEELTSDGKPHLQGHLKFSNQIRRETLKQWLPTAHWEDTKNERRALGYCLQANKRAPDGRVWSKHTLPPSWLYQVPQSNETVSPPQWHDVVEGWLLEEPQQREIVWVFDVQGNTGKTWFIKRMVKKYFWATFCTCTKKADIVSKGSRDIAAYLLSYPRQMQEMVGIYAAMEELKDNMFDKAKLQKVPVSVCEMWNPHVFVFANWAPQREYLSADRWNVWEIVNGNLVKR